MKKYSYYLVVCVFLALPSILVAQELKDFMRYEYILTYKPFDKKITPNVEPIVEKIYLDVDGSNSVFLTESSYLQFVADIKEEEIKVSDSAIPWTITKAGSNLVTYDIINYIEFYKVKQPVNLIKWTISDKVEDYHGMKVQKAEGELSGRIWTVWFTTEVPIIDGPYKFKNLPGFVVKASDKEQDYVFEFVESKKVSNYWFDLDSTIKVKEITDKQLKQLKNKSSNMSFIQAMEQSGFIVAKNSFDGDDFMNKKQGKEPNPIEFY
jgi:GLPGLI family protein